LHSPRKKAGASGRDTLPSNPYSAGKPDKGKRGKRKPNLKNKGRIREGSPKSSENKGGKQERKGNPAFCEKNRVQSEKLMKRTVLSGRKGKKQKEGRTIGARHVLWKPRLGGRRGS